MIVFLKIMSRKQICIMSQFFTFLHKINKSNIQSKNTQTWLNRFLVLEKCFLLCFYFQYIFFYIPQEHVQHHNYWNKQFRFCYKIKQSNAYLHLHIHQGLLRVPHPLFFRQIISWKNTIKILVQFYNTFVFQSFLKNEMALKIPFLFILKSRGRRMTRTSSYNSFSSFIFIRRMSRTSSDNSFSR